MTMIHRSEFVYFRDEARRLGMDNVKSAADMEIWCYIMKHQKDPKNPAACDSFMQEYCNV